MEKRRQPRALVLTLPETRRPYLVIEGKNYTLRNISEGGIGIWLTPPMPMAFQKEKIIDAQFVFGGKIYPVKFQVMHATKKMAGLKMVEVSAPLREELAELLKPSRYAASLKAAPKMGTEDSVGGYKRLWFVGEGDSELVVWFNDKNQMIVAMQLCWLGQWVYRAQFQPARTGYLREGYHVGQGVLTRDDDFLLEHTLPDTALLQSAAQFLVALSPPLPGHLLWQFLETGEQVYLPSNLFEEIKVA